VTVLELMERTGMREETLAIAYIKDAIPRDLIAIESVSVLDTSDSKYKKIKRLSNQPHYIVEDTSP
jgi:ribosomal protein L20A (L18A)